MFAGTHVRMKEQPSGRLIDQRIRNRIMEAIETFADGDDGVRREGPAKYFENFYDWIPHRDYGGMRPNSAITPEESLLLVEVSSIVDDACDATPVNMTAEEFIATGWPRRIQPIALDAIHFMRERGRFSEDQEEEKPSKRKYSGSGR